MSNFFGHGPICIRRARVVVPSRVLRKEKDKKTKERQNRQQCVCVNRCERFSRPGADSMKQYLQFTNDKKRLLKKLQKREQLV